MRYLYVFLLCFFFTSCVGQITFDSETNKIKVYLLGTFHFAQMDSTYNVLDQEHQKSIGQLCEAIAKQRPDKVFVERQPEFEFQNKLDSLFQIYLNREKIKAKNEIFQVGFKVAKMLNHKKVYQCDNPGRYGYLAEEAHKYANENGQMGFVDATAKGTVIREDSRLDEDSIIYNSTLFDYMKWINSEAVMKSSHSSYVTNLPLIGSKDYYNYEDDDTLIGAAITADWYRRNIMIYTKMINQLSYNEKGIFLLMGADHIPIIKHLFESNPYFEVVDVKEWLK